MHATSLSDLPKGLSVQRRLYHTLFDPNIKDNYHEKFDSYTARLIILNLAVMVLETVPALFDRYNGAFHAFEVFSVVVFTVEYILRFYVAPLDEEFSKAKYPRLRYVFSFYALIDLFAIAPFYLAVFIPVGAEQFRLLRVMRLLRLFKLFRVLIPAIKEFKALNRGRTFRQKIFALVSPSEFGGKLHLFFDNLIMVWVVISVLAVILESVELIYSEFSHGFVVLDAVAVAIFSAEYVMRFYSCVEDEKFKHWVGGRYKFAMTRVALIDLIAVLPFFLEAVMHHLVDLRFLRIVRLARLLKLTRYTGATETLLAALKREWPVIAASSFIMMLLVVLAASLGYLFEHDAQPDKFENIPQAIYWSVVTLASVGYGDISPVTPAGRFMTIVLALVGIGIFAVPAAVLSSAFNAQLRDEREALHDKLYEMLEDGVISPEEQSSIDREAARMGLSSVDVARILKHVMQERLAEKKVGGIPFDVIAKRPMIAMEQFQIMLAQMRQLVDLSDRDRVSALISRGGEASDLERLIWSELVAHVEAIEARSDQANSAEEA